MIRPMTEAEKAMQEGVLRVMRKAVKGGVTAASAVGFLACEAGGLIRSFPEKDRDEMLKACVQVISSHAGYGMQIAFDEKQKATQ